MPDKLLYGWALLGALFVFRNPMKDVLAGFRIRTLGTFRNGRYVSTPLGAGQVSAVGWRTTQLRDAEGWHSSVPNRQLLSSVTRVHAGGFPRITLPMTLPQEIPLTRVKRVVMDLPWYVMGTPVVVERDLTETDRIWLSFSIVDVHYEGRAKGRILGYAAELSVRETAT